MLVIERIWIEFYDNVLNLPEGVDFGALHWHPSTNFERGTNLQLTTEAALLGS
ncbi:MAG: hypothetical protein LAT51_12880 [Flavobacteriaceae bacterium]|nr:hypothetical protein [Flavobacteriaceae bacterium]